MEAGKLVRFLRSCGLQAGGSGRERDRSSPRSGVEECLECPVCWEGMNAGANAPFVLFCGHTLCRTCLLGLPWANLRIPSLHVQLPLLICCPWCQFLTLRLRWKGRLRFPAKNYFLLSIIESVRGCSTGSESACGVEEEEGQSRGCSSEMVSKVDGVRRRLGQLLQVGFSAEQRRSWRSVVEGLGSGEWGREEVVKLMILVFQVVAKVPLVCLLLYLVLYVLPLSALALVLFCLLTLVFAVPAYLVLYFSYPSLQWLAREIAAA